MSARSVRDTFSVAANVGSEERVLLAGLGVGESETGRMRHSESKQCPV